MSKEEKKSLLTGQRDAGYGTGPPGYGVTTDDYYHSEYNTLVEDDVSVCCWPCKSKKRSTFTSFRDDVPEDHCHRVRRSGLNKKASKQLLIATGLCFFFMITEAVGGYVSNSIAVLTDAAHLCTDLFAFIVSLGSVALAARKPSPVMTFGWKRAEVIGAIISVLLIWVITAILVDLAVKRVTSPDYTINAPVMLGTSAVGIMVNIIMGCTLNQDNTGADKEININVRAAFIHILGDLIQSIGVFSAALTIYMRPDWIIADPICTFIFSVIVLCTTIGVLRDAIRVLLAATPMELDAAEVASALLDLPPVVALHGLRLWSLSMDTNAVMVHLAVKNPKLQSEATALATNVLRNKFRFYEICVQVDIYKVGMEQCTICGENKKLFIQNGLTAA